MKVLWIINAPFPTVSKELNLDSYVKGWVYSSAIELIKNNSEIELAVASIYDGKKFMELVSGKIKHFLIPQIARLDAANTKNDIYWQKVKKLFNPDLIHIHGTEYPYSYSFVRACGANKVIVSIQGLVSVIDRYYLGGISKKELKNNITLRDIVRKDTVFSKHRNLKFRAKYEVKLLQNVKHIIGRTIWDKIHAKEINSNLNYHFCNETLRDSFYNNKWSPDSCTKHSIFVSQANYPLKGFHQLVKALPSVVKKFPDTKVYVAGKKVYNKNGIINNGYGRYLNKLISKYKLNKYIIYTGFLSEQEMCQYFILANVTVSPSIIENSSNSIGEAQVMGVPCIATYAGGTPDMIEHGKTGLLYRFEEHEMLASYICKIFSDDKFAQYLSGNSINEASKRHNRTENAKTLFSIYSKIRS